MNSITVLLTGVGAPGAASIIKCLRNNGERNIRVVGVDMNNLATGRCLVDVFYKVPSAKDPLFLDAIISICKRESVEIIVPLVTKELELFSEEKERFEPLAVNVAVMNIEQLKIANNKGLLLSTLAKNGIAVPEYTIVRNVDQVYEVIQRMGYPKKPLVIKPTFGNGSRGTRFLNSEVSRFDLFFNEKPNTYHISVEELVSILRERNSIPEMMIMEYLPGTEYSVDILANKGTVTSLVCRKGLNVESSIMTDSVIVENKYLRSYCQKIVSQLCLDGNIGIDLKEDAHGNPLIMEINPRLTAGIAACAVAGVNLPYLGIKQALGEKIDNNVEAAQGYVMQRRYREIFFDNQGMEIEW